MVLQEIEDYLNRDVIKKRSDRIRYKKPKYEKTQCSFVYKSILIGGEIVKITKGLSPNSKIYVKTPEGVYAFQTHSNLLKKV